MRPELVLQCLGALTEDDVVQTSSEVRVFLLFHPVLLHLKLPHFECNRVGGIRVCRRRRDRQLEVSNSLSELGGVLGVCPSDVVDDFLRGLDVLIGTLLPGRIVDETFERRFPSFKFRLALPGNIGAWAIVLAIVPAVAPATASSASSGSPILRCACRRTLTGRWCSGAAIAVSGHPALFVFYVESR